MFCRVLQWLFFLIPETNQNIDRAHIKPAFIINSYKQIFSSKLFLGYVMLSGSGIGVIIGFAALSSFLIQTELHHTAVFNGWVIMLIVLFSILGKAYNSYLVKRMEVVKRCVDWRLDDVAIRYIDVNIIILSLV